MYLGVPVEKKIVLGQDKDGKDVALTVALILPGEFLMGSTDEEVARLVKVAKQPEGASHQTHKCPSGSGCTECH